MGEVEAKKEKKDTFEIIWRNLGIVLIAILIYCIPGFLSFKDIALAKGYRFARW